MSSEGLQRLVKDVVVTYESKTEVKRKIVMRSVLIDQREKTTRIF